MGFLDFFKFKPEPGVEDAFFGPLLFLDFKDAEKNYFEGEGLFAPQNTTIGYLIDGDLPGPTIAQQAFYQTLQNSFDEYIERIIPLIIEEFRNWKPDFAIQDFAIEFTLVHVRIPRMDRRPLVWELSFTTIHDLNHHVSIDFLDEQPIRVLVDG